MTPVRTTTRTTSEAIRPPSMKVITVFRWRWRASGYKGRTLPHLAPPATTFTPPAPQPAWNRTRLTPLRVTNDVTPSPLPLATRCQLSGIADTAANRNPRYPAAAISPAVTIAPPRSAPAAPPTQHSRARSVTTCSPLVQSSGEEHPPAPEVSRKGSESEPAPGLEPGTARLQGRCYPPHLAPYQRLWLHRRPQRVPETARVDSISRHEPCHARARHREDGTSFGTPYGRAARPRMTAGSP